MVKLANFKIIFDGKFRVFPGFKISWCTAKSERTVLGLLLELIFKDIWNLMKKFVQKLKFWVKKFRQKVWSESRKTGQKYV